MSLPNGWKNILKSEAKQGYLNSGVMGGFAEWLTEAVNILADDKFNNKIKNDIKILAGDYSRANLLERPLIFNQITALLETADWQKKSEQKQEQKISPIALDAKKALDTSVQFLKGVGPK
ncbi:MAG: hypothetical protein ACOX7J_07295, partial [Bacillota bacterium]